MHWHCGYKMNQLNRKNDWSVWACKHTQLFCIVFAIAINGVIERLGNKTKWYISQDNFTVDRFHSTMFWQTRQTASNNESSTAPHRPLAAVEALQVNGHGTKHTTHQHVQVFGLLQLYTSAEGWHWFKKKIHTTNRPLCCHYYLFLFKKAYSIALRVIGYPFI